MKASTFGIAASQPPRRADIRLDIVEDNLRRLRADAAGRPMVIDLRGDAYGHGAVAIAGALRSSDVAGLLVSHHNDADDLLRIDGALPVHVGRDACPADAVVVGPELFGLDTSTIRDPTARGLRSAMTLSARVLSVKSVGAGEGVSYGYVYRTKRATTLAMVCLGYSDGIDRHACDRGMAWYADALHPIAGRVAMDVFMLDVGDNAVLPGADVVMFGDETSGHPSVMSWARSIDKTAAEVTSALGNRIVRSYR